MTPSTTRTCGGETSSYHESLKYLNISCPELNFVNLQIFVTMQGGYSWVCPTAILIVACSWAHSGWGKEVNSTAGCYQANMPQTWFREFIRKCHKIQKTKSVQHLTEKSTQFSNLLHQKIIVCCGLFQFFSGETFMLRCSKQYLPNRKLERSFAVFADKLWDV